MKLGIIAIVSITAVLAGGVVLIGCASATGLDQGANVRAVAANKQPERAALDKLDTYEDREFDGELVTKTDAEWKQLLTAEQFNILREAGTERPYTGEYANNHEHGIYYCSACGLAVFKSETKFESGTGWPSFYKPIFPKNVTEKVDNSLSESRTEILCSRCHGHLGHVFDDGPKPTGLRYCMNSAALTFKKK